MSISTATLSILPADEAADLPYTLRHYGAIKLASVPKPLHPLIFDHDIKYRGGRLYRYLLGYNVIPDKVLDNKLEAHLDKTMHQESEEGEYDLAAYYVHGSKLKNVDPYVIGQRWIKAERPPKRHAKLGKTRLKSRSMVYIRSCLRHKTTAKNYYEIEGLDIYNKKVIIRATEYDFLKFFQTTRLKRVRETKVYDFFNEST